MKKQDPSHGFTHRRTSRLTHRVTRCRTHGFTLVELLVVIVIIGLLVALMLSAIQQAREAARRMQCQKNLREIGTAIANFESSRKVFPAARRGSDTYCYNSTPPGKEDKYHYGSSGFVSLLPYLEQNALFSSLKDGEILPGTTTAEDLEIVKPYCEERPSIFVCPIMTRNRLFLPEHRGRNTPPSGRCRTRAPRAHTRSVPEIAPRTPVTSRNSKTPACSVTASRVLFLM